MFASLNFIRKANSQSKLFLVLICESVAFFIAGF